MLEHLRRGLRRTAAVVGLAAVAAVLVLAAPSPRSLALGAHVRPEEALAAAAGLLAWLLLLWLAAGALLTAAAAAPGAAGRVAAAVARRTTPVLVRRAVGAALGLAVLGASPAAAATPSPGPGVPVAAAPAAASAGAGDTGDTGYDWPASAPAAAAGDEQPPPDVHGGPGDRPTPAAAGQVAADRAPPADAPRPGSVGGQGGAGLLGPPDPSAPDADGTVVVAPGDSLWRIAARALGAGASEAQVAAEWPRWWDANRDVVGPDPDLLLPGQRLHAPAAYP